MILEYPDNFIELRLGKHLTGAPLMPWRDSFGSQANQATNLCRIKKLGGKFYSKERCFVTDASTLEKQKDTRYDIINLSVV